MNLSVFKCLSLLLPGLLFIFGCANSSAGPEKSNLSGTPEINGSISQKFRDTILLINTRAVDLRYPEGKIKGVILCLPGWNFSKTDVCEKSSLCERAKEAGFILVLPEMGKSIYASALYEETRPEWRKYPQLKFITDTLIPYLQKTNELFKPGGNNFLYGISTGARGTGIIALNTDTLFKAAAGLSGDYEQIRMTNDNLMKGYNGEYTKFKERWEKDNPYAGAAIIRVQFYLAHGDKDKVVPVEQTMIFHEKLMKEHPGAKHELHIVKDAGHDYDFWGKETDSILKFFGQFCK